MAKRKTISPEEQVQIIRKHLVDNVPVSDLADQVEGMGDVHLLEDVIRWDIFDGDGDFIEVVANVLG